MKTITFIVDIREKDIDGNKIDVKAEENEIQKTILKFWNVAGLDVKEN